MIEIGTRLYIEDYNLELLEGSIRVTVESLIKS